MLRPRGGNTSTAHPAARGNERGCPRGGGARRDQVVADPLMVPLLVVVLSPYAGSRLGQIFGHYGGESSGRPSIRGGDLGANYLIGRQFWSPALMKRDGQLYRSAYQKLLSDPQSP